jgi:hypothetical protein
MAPMGMPNQMAGGMGQMGGGMNQFPMGQNPGMGQF